MDLQLNGKTALITGSSAGIGEAIAVRLAEEGARVIIHGRNEARAQAVAKKITDAGGQARVAIGDLGDDTQAAAALEQAINAFDGLDIVVNNAGGYDGTDWSADTKQWGDIYNQNVLSMVRVINATRDHLKGRGWGRFIQIASVVGSAPWAGTPDYNATKAANLNMTVGLSKDLAGTGVTVNSVSPGPVRTPGLEEFFQGVAGQMGISGSFEEIEPQIVGTLMPQIGSKRTALPGEIADAVAFLASPRADYITGANLRVDGGFVAAVN